MKKQRKKKSDLPSFLAETARQARRERSQAQRRELDRLRASYPRVSPSRKSSKRDEFDFKKIYAETTKFVNAQNLPKLKNPAKASKVTKAKLLKAFDEISRRKQKGMVFYPIKGKKQRANFEKLFDEEGQTGLFKGGWIDASKSNSGKAKLKFDKAGNPSLKFGKKFTAVYIPIDGPELLADPEGYLRKALRRFKNTQVFFPVTVRDIVCKGYGASKSSTPAIWDVLQQMDQDSGNSKKSLGDFIGALVTYAKS